MDFFFVIWAIPFTVVIALSVRRIIKQLRNTKELIDTGIKTTGVVIGYKTRLTHTLNSHPKFQFTTLLGEVVEVEARMGISLSTLHLYQKGSRVTIYYEAQNPKNFTLDSESEKLSSYVQLFFLGLVVVTAAYFWLTSN
jgi:hypothetical protein